MRNTPLLSTQLCARATALALAVLANPLAAEAIGLPRLVADQATDIQQRSSLPSEFARVGDRIVFAASDPLHGMELRGTDLDGSRVELLSDAEPGTQGSYPRLLEQIGSVAFYGVQVAGESRLWVSDGTRLGTRAARDESGSMIRARPSDFFSSRAATDRFLAVAGVSSTSRIDGLWSVWPGGSAILLHRGEPNRSWIYYGVRVVGDRVFFLAEDPERRRWLGQTDGTASGTHLVVAVPGFSDDSAGTTNRYFFAGWSEGRGYELWVSDGTAIGTRVLVAFGDWPHLAPLGFIAGRSRVYFLEHVLGSSDHFWVSDGTESGTHRLIEPDLRPTDFWGVSGGWIGESFVFLALHSGRPGLWVQSAASSPPLPLVPDLPELTIRSGFLALGDHLLFLARSTADEDIEIWRTDGTAHGTRAISGSCVECDFTYAGDGVVVEDRALYQNTYRSSMFGSSWTTIVTDGTEYGTRVLNDTEVDPVTVHTQYRGQVARAAGAFALAGVSEASSTEPWLLGDFDGSLRLLGNLEPESAPALPARLACSGEDLYWVVLGTSASQELYHDSSWSLDTSTGTLRRIPPYACGSNIVEAVADLGHHRLFRESQGSSATSPCLASFDPLTDSWTNLTSDAWAYTFLPFVSRGGFLFFAVEEAHDDGRRRIWRSDGTLGGTSRIAVDGLPRSFELISATSTHLFVRQTYAGGDVFSLPLAGGTASPIATPTQVVSHDSDLEQVVVDDRIYFTGRELPTRERLYVSDGTQVGTSVLWTSPEESEDRLLDLFAWGDQLLFLVASDRLTLWRSDGSANGTTAIADLGSLSVDPDDSSPRQAISHAGRLYFTAETEETGAELWATDGTAAGTRSLDLVPGGVGSEPRFLAVAGGRLFFAAEADNSGREVWTTDGTVAGTRRVSDIAAGSDSAAPEELVAVGDTLYFSADDGFRGRELWAIDTNGDGRCIPEAHRLCLQDGRFSVEIQWHDERGHSASASAFPLSSSSGAFWFFDADNIEAVVKVHDGRALNDHFWLFAGSLTDRGYNLQITDTATRTTRRTTNPPGQLTSFSDIEAFAAGSSQPPAKPLVSTAARSSASAAHTPPGACIPSATRLCLQQGRFAVEASWRDFLGNEGTAQAGPHTLDSGTFWFFDDDNPELAVKMLDGRALNSHFWFYCGALSDVEYTLTVTDTLTGARRQYANRAGQLASFADVDAF
ncbi:MAG: hypothetical protein IPJ17_11490 [Holophagales bacterium]|nr:MAG: hypothetical protein IPJ17_11490 [Holophagales bacterium]